MSALPNAFRRGAVYWWRRTTCLARSGKSLITLSLSLLTKELGVARGRAAAMTAQSEKVRMSLYKQVAREGLTHEQQRELVVREMRACRDALEHEAARWQADTRLSDFQIRRATSLCSRSSGLRLRRPALSKNPDGPTPRPILTASTRRSSRGFVCW